MSVNGVLKVETQIHKIDALEHHCFGFQEQMVDLAENVYLITHDICDILCAGLSYVDKLKEYHISRDKER